MKTRSDMPSDKKVIAVRLDDATHDAVAALAAQERRSLASMVEVLMLRGLGDFQRSAKRAKE
jgi:hypothetical protein